MKCGLEAQKLNLSIEEQNQLEKAIHDGVKDNDKLKSLIAEHKTAQEQVNGLRLEKRERSLADKGTIDGYTDAIKLSKDKLDKAELQQLKEDNKQRRSDRSETIKDYNNSIESLMNAKRTLVAQKKSLSDFIKQTQSKIVSTYIRGNADGVRKSLVLQQFADGKLTAKEIFDPARLGPHSLMTVKQRISDSLGKNTKELVEKALIDPEDYSNIHVKALHDDLIVKINNEARRLGVLEKHGLEIDQKPFALSHDMLRSKLFNKRRFKNIREGILKAQPILSKEGLEEYKNDWISSIGSDEIQRIIDKGYENKTIKPSIDQAFEDMRDSLINGDLPRLNFSNPTFIDEKSYSYMVSKYSDKNMVQNLVSFTHRKINDLAVSETTGGRLSTKDLQNDKSISNIALNYYKSIIDNGYGEQIGTSAARFARNKLINGYGKLVLATRPVTMYISPMADRPIAAALNNTERETLATLPLELFRGFGDILKSTKTMVGHGEAKESLNDAAELFKIFSHDTQDRYAVEESPLGENNLFNKSVNYLAGASINHFHVQDNALRVVSNRDFSMQVNKYKSFDDIPQGYRDILETQHHINADDWKQIRKVGKDSDFITSEKFNGILANKVASIELTANLRGMPNEFPLDYGLSSKIKALPGGDILHKALTQFWGFAIRTSVYGFRNAYETKGSWGMAEYGARLMARGFIPNMVVSSLITLARTGSFSQTYDDMTSEKGMLDAMLGTISRPAMALSIFLSPNQAAYKVSSPLMRDTWNIMHSAVSSGKAVINGDDRKAGVIVLNQFMQLGVPAWSQTPFNKDFKDYIKNN